MMGKRMSGSGQKGRASSSGASTSKRNEKPPQSPAITAQIVQIPQVKIQENAKLLPRYSAALARPHDESLPAEDLDAIQQELEVLLSSVALRYRVLKNEFETIDNKDRKSGKLAETRQPISPGKRKRADGKGAGNSAKLMKLTKVKTNAQNSPALSGGVNTDDSSDAVQYFNRSGQRDNNKILLPKNDTPNKFWLSVEPYCMPLTQEDIKLLDDLIDNYSGEVVPPIPELGPHYSTQWATEDLREEQDNSKVNKTGGRPILSETMLKRGEKLMGDGITGPLTQRLVSVLMEENLIPDSGLNVDSNSNSSENTSSTTTTNTTNSSRALTMMKNGISIERRVRKELIEQGILEPEDFVKSVDDEIHNEIKRVRHELQAISEHNFKELKQLHIAAKEEMKRLEVKRKLDAIDQEIIESYRKVMTAKQKRRQLTKQEKDDIFHLAEEQKRLSDLLESMPMPGPNYVGAV